MPNGADINTAGPYAQKTVELWFNAGALPAPGTTGLAAANTLYLEGGASRGLDLYLWRDPANPDPNSSQLVFNAWDNAGDGPGSPWGVTSPPTTQPVYAQTNTPLSPERIAAHYQAALTPPLAPAQTVSSAPPAFGNSTYADGLVGIGWSGSAQLQRATNISGPFTTTTNATSPYSEPTTNAQVFFRLVQ